MVVPPPQGGKGRGGNVGGSGLGDCDIVGGEWQHWCGLWQGCSQGFNKLNNQLDRSHVNPSPRYNIQQVGGGLP